MEKRRPEELTGKLYATLASLTTKEDAAALLEDLCTYKEIEQMAERLAAAQLLIDGKTYAQVIEEVEISSATLSRVSRCVQFGSGYTRVLKPTEKKEPEKTE